MSNSEQKDAVKRVIKELQYLEIYTGKVDEGRMLLAVAAQICQSIETAMPTSLIAKYVL
jgi:hypothetical protein